MNHKFNSSLMIHRLFERGGSAVKWPHIMGSIHNAMEQKQDLLKTVPIAELAGYNRLLVENHQGVLAYSPLEIQMKVSFGKIAVTGTNLQLMQISREQLVITGRITGIQVIER